MKVENLISGINKPWMLMKAYMYSLKTIMGYTVMVVMDRLLSKQLTVNYELIVTDNRSDEELSGNNSSYEMEGLILLLMGDNSSCC